MRLSWPSCSPVNRATTLLYPAWTTIRQRNGKAEPRQEQEDGPEPIDTLFVQLHTRDRIYWRGFEQIRDPRHQRIVGFRTIGALSNEYEREEAPSVTSWLNTLFEPLPEEGEETDVDRELADMLEEPEVSAALYPRQMRALH